MGERKGCWTVVGLTGRTLRLNPGWNIGTFPPAPETLSSGGETKGTAAGPEESASPDSDPPPATPAPEGGDVDADADENRRG